MKFMEQAPILSYKRATIQLGADHSAYTDDIPGNGVAIGTITIRDQSGALVYMEQIGGYIMITPNRLHRMEDRKVTAAIVKAVQEQQLDLATCSTVVRGAIERAQIDYQRFQQQWYEKIQLNRQRETEKQQEKQKQD